MRKAHRRTLVIPAERGDAISTVRKIRVVREPHAHGGLIKLYYWDIVIAVPVARARLAGQATPRNPFLVKSDHGFLASSENAVTSHLPSMKKPQHVLQP